MCECLTKRSRATAPVIFEFWRGGGDHVTGHMLPLSDLPLHASRSESKHQRRLDASLSLANSSSFSGNFLCILQVHNMKLFGYINGIAR